MNRPQTHSLLLLGASALLWAVGCASSPTVVPSVEITPARLYPMAAGSAWSYDVDTGDGAIVLAIARVTEASANTATIQGGEGATHYELRPDGIYRSERRGYLLKSPIRDGAEWDSGNGMHARITRLGVTLDTPAGHYSSCVEVVERGAQNGAVINTTYCPNVGPVQVISSMQLTLAEQSVQVVAKLRGFRIGPEPAPGPEQPAE